MQHFLEATLCRLINLFYSTDLIKFITETQDMQLHVQIFFTDDISSGMKFQALTQNHSVR